MAEKKKSSEEEMRNGEWGEAERERSRGAKRRKWEMRNEKWGEEEEQRGGNENWGMRNEEKQRATIFTSSPGSGLAWHRCWPPSLFLSHHCHLFLHLGWQHLENQFPQPTCFGHGLGFPAWEIRHFKTSKGALETEIPWLCLWLAILSEALGSRRPSKDEKTSAPSKTFIKDKIVGRWPTMMFQCMRDWISINATIFLPSGFNSHPSWFSCKMAIIDAFLDAVHYTFGKFSKRNGHISPK